MLTLLVWASLLVLFLTLAGHADRDETQNAGGLTAAYIKAVVLWGALLIFITEGLSLFQAITRTSLGLTWGLAFVAFVFLGVRKGAATHGWGRLVEACRRADRLEWIFLAALLAICLTLLLIAVVSPPNNVDSLIYHMARVVHWAQNQSLRHYVAANAGQNLKPIWAEAAILNLRVLWGSDRPANLVQWFSMVTSLVAVSGLAKLLGASRRGQMLAVAFAVSVPMGILQATSTQNDYVTAMWILCLAYFAVLAKRFHSDLRMLTFIGLSLGLGMLTKGTAYAYAFPFLLWIFLPRLRRPGFVRTLAQGAMVGVVAIGLNLGVWIRNSSTYGGMFGPLSGLASGPLILTRLVAGTPEQGEGFAGDGSAAQELGEPGGTGEPAAGNTAQPKSTGLIAVIADRVHWLLRRIAQNLGQNTVMPTSFLTSRLWNAMRRLPWLFSEEFVGSLGQGLWNHEDTAGSLIHLVLGLASILWLAILAIRQHAARTAAIFGLVTFAGYLMLTLISTSVELFGVRYQLSFFILCAPVVAAAFSRGPGEEWLPASMAMVLLVTAIPYVLLNNTRPLIGWRPKTRVGSVLTTPPADVLFAIVPEFEDEYLDVASIVRDSGCRSVALNIGPKPLEYLWWWVLDAPQSGVRIEITGDNLALEQAVDPILKPCAVICTTCGKQAVEQELPLSVDLGHVRLFSASP